MAKTIREDVQELRSHGAAGAGVLKYQVKASTANATPVVVKKIPVAELSGVYVRVQGAAVRPEGTEMIRTDIVTGCRRAAAGNVTQLAAATSVTANDSSGTPTITLVANTTDQTVDVTITGEAAKTFKWFLDIEEVTL
jgi:hypothetical protein